MDLRKFLIDTVEAQHRTGNESDNGYQETPRTFMVLNRYMVLAGTAAEAMDRFMTQENSGTLVSTLDIGNEAFVVNIQEDDGQA